MDTFLDAVRLHVFLSLPQSFILWLFVFSLLRPLPHKLIRRMLLFIVIHSVYTDIFVLLIPVYLQFANTLIAIFVLIFLLFKELELRKKLFVFVGIVLISIVSDMITVTVASYIGVPDIETSRRENLPEIVSIMYPQLLIAALAGWLIRKRKSNDPLKNLFANIDEKRPLLRLFALLFVQFVIIASIVGVQYTFNSDKRLVTTVLIYFTISCSLFAIFFMIRLLTRTRTEAIRTTQALYVDDINNMFTSVRGQRHDFLNHVQVIHTMAQMGKYEQLRAYTSNLVQETREVSDIINHTAPALAAFAQAKTTVALGYGIAFTCELPDQWNVPDSAINMLDIIKILGNLVDNAFDESTLLPAGERSVHVSIQTTADGITLKVSNRGRPIDEKTRALIFQAGYSTKGEGHSGLGLAIIQERVRHYSGKFDVESDSTSGTTIFSVRLPCELRSFVEQPAS
ncbi:sensor histidine kinase [Cohnella sp. GCM10027633]|uniref:sensor histidine kinase n=1 Tax=unclassified Cohnella TaxID=2636738 RepID=UPI0036347242